MAENHDDQESTARRGSGSRAGAAGRGKAAAGGAHAADDAENVTVRVDLPPAPHPEMPDDEVAVAIDDVAVNPGSLGGVAAPITSVEVVTPALARGGRGSSSMRRDSSPYGALLAADASRLRRERVSTETGSHVAVVDVPDDELVAAEAHHGSRSSGVRRRRSRPARARHSCRRGAQGPD